jgi:hypothetical protein
LDAGAELQIRVNWPSLPLKTPNRTLDLRRDGHAIWSKSYTPCESPFNSLLSMDYGNLPELYFKLRTLSLFCNAPWLNHSCQCQVKGDGFHGGLLIYALSYQVSPRWAGLEN